MAVMLAGCSGSRGGLPRPIATIPEGTRTALVADRPTLPPTFTPSPTQPLTIPESPSPILGTPTATLTLTPTLAPSPTRTPPPIPSATPTWTPDVRLLPPTRLPTSGPTRTPLPIPTFNASGTPIAFGCSGIANAPNLLNNGGFEGTTYIQGYGDMTIPEGWTAFWKPEGTPVTYDPNNTDGYFRPEMRIVPNAPPYTDPPRVLAGQQALLVTGGNKVFDAGVFQQVEVYYGDMLCLTGFAHAWSSHRSDDPFHSLLETNDDRRNANFQLGIDPTGGTVPWSPVVIWGAAAHLYDTYQPIPGIQAQAKFGTVTVFVRGYTMWRFDHNDLFFDDIRLVRVPGS